MGAVTPVVGHKPGGVPGCRCWPCLALRPAPTTLEEQLARLHIPTRARVLRFLAHRGSMKEFAKAEGFAYASAFQFFWTQVGRGGPLGAAMQRARDIQAGTGMREEDLIPCTRCSLRGHVAGDPERCIGLRGTGLGQSPFMTGEGGL